MQLGDSDSDRSNVEDRRGLGGAGLKLGLGGTVIVFILSMVFRTDLFSLLGGAQPADGTGAPAVSSAPATNPETTQRGRAEQGLEKVAIGTFNDTQKTWSQALAGSAHPYHDAKMVLFWDQTRSGCGAAGAEMGPFYCPVDERVYIDLGFYRELAQRFGAPGDFAQAYVIAHELGHHVQNVLGISGKVQAEQQRNPSLRNSLSVKIELQADCLAGVWGHTAAARKLLDPGDVEAGLRAAAAVGDDHIQKMAGRRVSPESFTHGSAADRSRWFRRGFDSGSAKDCDTFAGQ